MKFDWDPAKAESNVRKHGVRFADAVTALEDELALTMRDPFAEGEERWVTLAWTRWDGRWVVYTWRDDSIRVISARRATPSERRQSERQQHGESR